MRKLVVMLAMAVLASCKGPELSTNKQAASDLQELHRTLWLVTATPRVGQVVRLKVNDDATAGIANSTNVMADMIAKQTGFIEKKPDLDRTANLNSTTGVNVAISLLRFAGNLADSSISADADATRTARFSFKQVIVEQPTAVDLLQQQVRKLDSDTPPDAADWWANINREAVAHAKDPTVVRKYYVVDSVYNVGQLDIATTNSRKAGLDVSCTFLTKKCGELKAGTSGGADATQSGAKPFFVLLRPFYENNGVLFLDGNASAAVAAVVE